MLLFPVRMRLASLAILCAACSAPAAPPPLPWINGFAPSASGDIETAVAADKLAGIVGVADEEGYGAIAVATKTGTVFASYAQGVAVVDREDRIIARAPGFDFGGSADDVVAVAVGDAQLDKPVIVMAITSGGHRESTTSLLVFDLAARGRLEPLFVAPIEDHDGDETHAGAVTFVPRGLVYRSPYGVVEHWKFDRARRKYVRTATRPAAELDPETPVL